MMHTSNFAGRLWLSVAALLAWSVSLRAQSCPTGPALTAGTQHCSSNQTGTIGSFGWSIWSSGSGGCITPYGNTAAFKATWNNSADFLAREGFQWNETKTYDQYGTVSADYAFTKTGTGGGYSFMGIYGWSNNPLVEYYIVDDWYGDSTRAPTAGGSLKGTFTVDSGSYKVYTHQQVNQPSIHGTTTFMQFFSIRQKPRHCGHINLTAHYDEWKSLGMLLGNMYEAKLLVEVGGGVGSIDFTVANMTSGTTSTSAPTPKHGLRFIRAGEVSMGDGKRGLVSLVSLNGTVIASARQGESKSAFLPTATAPKGLYLLRFQGDDGSFETQKFLVE